MLQYPYIQSLLHQSIRPRLAPWSNAITTRPMVDSECVFRYPSTLDAFYQNSPSCCSFQPCLLELLDLPDHRDLHDPLDSPVL